MLHEKKKINWDRFFQAFTDENQAFNFPIKYPAIDLDRSTKQSFYITSSILAGGMILAALIVANAKKK
jgi:hypothetical protein